MEVSKFSPSLERLVQRISQLPGLGRKSASRLALYILRQPEEEARELAQAILDVKSRIRLCSVCSNFTEDEVCSICGDARRDRSLICVVETPGDVLRLERTGSFRGLYHVLGGALSPLYLARALKEYSVKVSQIARGVPVGAELEQVDEATLTRAIEARTPMT
jgi:recombination protein RecR